MRLTFFNLVMDFFFKLLIFFVVIVLGMGLLGCSGRLGGSWQ
jgi:hypothetical protein